MLLIYCRVDSGKIRTAIVCDRYNFLPCKNITTICMMVIGLVVSMHFVVNIISLVKKKKTIIHNDCI